MNREVQSLFHQVADLTVEQRELYFRERHVRDELRTEVEALLEFDAQTGSSLTCQMVESAENLLEPVGEWAGGTKGPRCGPYELIRVLGRGGMATVYLARRADGEVEQQVAVKLIRFPGNDPAFRDRFLRERQILATLHHPAIAHLLDAGRASNGQPYLAMEYVDGVPIDVYARKLDLRAKLSLFCQVCDAVSYAHRNLVVHRDLKPSNILVDREGRPKLLDFGIAKLLDPATSVGEEATATQFQPLTPQYASPEQVRGQSIATTTDVYSLGVVLYKLLTGRLPYEFPTLAPSVVDRTICEAPPARPNVSEDLDNIILMALRKEPARRYPSVQHLSDEVQRTLANRPVSARPDTFTYRASKFVRRNRIWLAAAVMAVAALVTGSAIAIQQARIARKRFEDVHKLAHAFVFDVHDEVAKLEGSTKAREMMVRIGVEYLDDFAKDSDDSPSLQREVAAGYMKIGDAQGYPTKPNLGRTADAVASYRKAGEIYERLAAGDTSYLPDLADYYRRFAGLIRFSNGPGQARELSEKAIETLERIRAQGTWTPELAMTYAGSFCTLGDMDEDLARYSQSFQDFSRCAALARAQVNKNPSQEALSALSQAEERIGTAAQETGLLTASRQALDEDEALLARLSALEPRNPQLHRRQALLYEFRSSLYDDEMYPNFGDPARALANARQYLAMAREMVRGDPHNSSARFSRAVATYCASYPLADIDPKAAVQLAHEAVRMFDELKAAHSSYLIVSRRAIALRRLAGAEWKAGRLDEAWRSAQLALEAQRAVPRQQSDNAGNRMHLVRALLLAGTIAAQRGDSARAEALLSQARDVAASLASNHELSQLLPLVDSEKALGLFYAGRGRTAEARACYQRAVAIWQGFPESNEYVKQRRTAAQARLAALH